MKKALISPTELRYDNNDNEGYRVAVVSDVEFPVAEPLYWLDCPDDCIQDRWILVNGQLVNNPPVTVVELPEEPPEPIDIMLVI